MVTLHKLGSHGPVPMWMSFLTFKCLEGDKPLSKVSQSIFLNPNIIHLQHKLANLQNLIGPQVQLISCQKTWTCIILAKQAQNMFYS
jgi:hypothetical protein